MRIRTRIDDRVAGHLATVDDAPPTAWEIALVLKVSVDGVRVALSRLQKAGKVMPVGSRPRSGARTWRLTHIPEPTP